MLGGARAGHVQSRTGHVQLTAEHEHAAARWGHRDGAALTWASRTRVPSLCLHAIATFRYIRLATRIADVLIADATSTNEVADSSNNSQCSSYSRNWTCNLEVEVCRAAEAEARVDRRAAR